MGAEVSTFLEIEQTYAAPATTEVPDLTRIAEIDLVDSTDEYFLKALYFDTPDLRLAREKITLRRRTGGHDDGWHLKLPGREGRMEIGAALDGSPDGETVPESLVQRVRAIVRTQPLVPVAEVDNHRRESVLLGPDGHPVAHFCDDRVDAEALLEGGETTSWREWELELTPETAGTAVGRGVLESGTEVFASVGARISDSPSKLVRALGSTMQTAPVPPRPTEFESPNADDDPFAGILTALVEARGRLLAADPGARTGRASAMRDMLTATREIRSLISLFADLFVNSEAGDERLDHLLHDAARLAALARVLEDADRAHEVDKRMRLLLDEDQTGLVGDDAPGRLTQATRSRLTRSRGRVVAALESEDYLAVLDDLDEVLAAPPAPERAERIKATAIIVREIKRAYIEFRNLRRDALDTIDDPAGTHRELAQLFGEMLVATQTLQTAATLARRLTPYRGSRLEEQAGKLVAVLGQAAVADDTAAVIHRRARQAARRGVDTFGYGVLYQAEMQRFGEVAEQADARRDKTRKAYRRFKKSIAG